MPDKDKNILYMSYDGMTDPLGQSQVLPYIIGLSKRGYKFTLLSCEKKDRFEKNRSVIEAIAREHGIDWRPIPFTTFPPIIAKYYDIFKLKQKAIELQKEKSFAMTHCRSYISAEIGQMLKKRFGVPYFFDMRGFWVDERVDGGMWDLNNPLFKMAYAYYKKKEEGYIADADLIISLTEAGKREIESWKCYTKAPIGVIPCSADFDLFALSNPQRKADARQAIGIGAKDLVISYLGSIGTWYLLDEMLEVFARIKIRYSGAKFFFITPEPARMVLERAFRFGLKEEDFIFRFASRKEVPFFASASDINLFFIKQSYSKIASSPTKLGEVLALGIPVICNAKVGDVKEIVEFTDSGITIETFNEESYEKIVASIPSLLAKEPAAIREKAEEYYRLENAIEKYFEFYQQVLKEQKPDAAQYEYRK